MKKIIGIPFVSMPLTKENGVFIKNLLKKYLEWNKDDPWEDEGKELEEAISNFSKKEAILSKYYKVMKRPIVERPRQMVLSIENALLQKKISETNQRLVFVTFFLVISTAILAYATIVSSEKSGEIFSFLSSLLNLGLVILVFFLVLGVVWKVGKWVLSFLKKFLWK